MVSLVVPGSSERMLAKSREFEVDELVLDLEDAVTPDRKPEALQLVLQALAAGCRAARTAVRVNPVGSEWIETELSALAGATRRPDSVVLPKAEDSDDLSGVVSALQGIGVQALIETARGLSRVDELAARPGVEAVILGYADLAVSLGRTPVGAADLTLWLPAQERLLTAARAAGIRAIDGPFLGLEDHEALAASSSRAAQLGFDGKWAIHPGHLEVIAEAFRPDPQSVERAREVISALLSAPGRGAVQVNGQMVDEPVRLAALRTLERAGVDLEGRP